MSKAIFKKQFGKKFDTTANWAFFNEAFKKVSINEMENYVLVCDMSADANAYLNSLEKSSKQDYCIQLMSLPEYQMC